MVNANGAYLINTMFGWPMVPSADLPGGGPAYPLSALGVRARYRPIDSVTLLTGVFNGSPRPTQAFAAPAMRSRQNPSGTSFPERRRPSSPKPNTLIPRLGTMLYANQAQSLARVYKIGGWA
jgi:porin